MTEEKFNNYKKKIDSVFNHQYVVPEQKTPNTVKDKITVICKKHGEFKKTIDSLLNAKSGCPSCSKRKIPTNEEFVEKCKLVHKGKNYDFSKVKYTGSGNKVTVICHEVGHDGIEHGEFDVRASHLLNGSGCPKCSGRSVSQSEWIAKARLVHGDKYDYSNIKYVGGRRNKVEIICHQKDENGVEHGPFIQEAASHLTGCGCPKCSGGAYIGKDYFVSRAIGIHGNKYDYSKVDYKRAKTPVEIICRRHGSFMQSPEVHLRGGGCPKCNASKLEGIVMREFEKNGIKYEYQVSIPKLGKKTIDFYVPLYDLYVECQGEQHFMDTDFGNHKKSYAERVKLDDEKYKAVIENGSKMFYYTVTEYYHKDKAEADFSFYKDKMLFMDVKEMVQKIKELEKKVAPPSIIDDFYGDLLQIDTSVVKTGNIFSSGKYKFVLNEVKENSSNTLSNRRKAYSNSGYDTIEIFADEYLWHREIVLDKIAHILNKNGEKVKIDARKCSVIEISKIDAEQFLKHFHLQGFASASVYVGCYYKNKLVGVMTFMNEGEKRWNLNRFATDTSFTCRGIGGKLFKWFIRTYQPIEVKTFADRRFTPNKDNNIYTKIGFKYDSRLSSDYRYFMPGKVDRFHKFAFRKEKLSRKFGFPMTMTEREMTERAGYKRIYDGGLFKYVWQREETE